MGRNRHSLALRTIPVVYGRRCLNGERITDAVADADELMRRRLLGKGTSAEHAFAGILAAFSSRQHPPVRSLLTYRRKQQFRVSSEDICFGDFYFRKLGLVANVGGSAVESLSAYGFHVVRFSREQIFRERLAVELGLACALLTCAESTKQLDMFRKSIHQDIEQHPEHYGAAIDFYAALYPEAWD